MRSWAGIFGSVVPEVRLQEKRQQGYYNERAALGLDSPMIIFSKSGWLMNFPGGCPGAMKHRHQAHHHGHRASRREQVSDYKDHPSSAFIVRCSESKRAERICQESVVSHGYAWMCHLYPYWVTGL